jgi:hypothetical protein
MNLIFKKELRNRDFDGHWGGNAGATSGAYPTDATFKQTSAVLTAQRKSRFVNWSHR